MSAGVAASDAVVGTCTFEILCYQSTPPQLCNSVFATSLLYSVVVLLLFCFFYQEVN